MNIIQLFVLVTAAFDILTALMVYLLCKEKAENKALKGIITIQQRNLFQRNNEIVTLRDSIRFNDLAYDGLKKALNTMQMQLEAYKQYYELLK